MRHVVADNTPGKGHKPAQRKRKKRKMQKSYRAPNPGEKRPWFLIDAKVVPEARFYEDLDIDSIDAVDLIVRLRKEVDFEIKSEDFKAIRTVGDLLDVLERIGAASFAKAEMKLRS